MYVHKHTILCSEVDIPDKLMPVGSTVSPKLPPAGTTTANPEDIGGRQERRSTVLDHGIALTTPPNMKQVLYQDSYDEFMRKKSPVKPVSHCWNAQQKVYIGCQHGQLLLVDFETGIVSIVANPEITVCSANSPKMHLSIHDNDIVGATKRYKYC